MSEQRWGDLKKRLMSSVIIIALVSGMIYFSQELWMRPFLAIVVLGLMGLATAELSSLFSSKVKFLSLPWMVFGTICLGASFFLSSQFPYFPLLPLFVCFFLFLFFFLIHFPKVEGALQRISFSFFSLVYVALPLSLLFLILYSYSWEGRLWMAYLLIVTKVSDIGAYFGGKIFGKHKLSLLLSPKKTWEGAIGGAILSAGVSFLFSFFTTEGFVLGGKEALILGLFLSLLGQLGDLSESLLKRDAHVKDSSKFSGLGGMLDMVDSLLFTTPFLYLFLMVR